MLILPTCSLPLGLDMGHVERHKDTYTKMITTKNCIHAEKLRILRSADGVCLWWLPLRQPKTMKNLRKKCANIILKSRLILRCHHFSTTYQRHITKWVSIRNESNLILRKKKRNSILCDSRRSLYQFMRHISTIQWNCMHGHWISYWRKRNDRSLRMSFAILPAMALDLSKPSSKIAPTKVRRHLSKFKWLKLKSKVFLIFNFFFSTFFIQFFSFQV